MQWIKIEDAKINGITSPISMENIELNKLGMYLNYYDKICDDKIIILQEGNIKETIEHNYGHDIWYKESRDYLLENGLLCCDKELPNDVCDYHKLFWNKNIFEYVKLSAENYTFYFDGTIEPILLTINDSEDTGTEYIEICLWKTNAFTNMFYRGCSLERDRRIYFGNLIKYVKLSYKGHIKRDVYKKFICGIPVPEPKKYKIENFPDVDHFKNEIIKNNIRKWNIHDCSICDYKCGYLFRIVDNNITVLYDSGCYCYPAKSRYSSLYDVIKYIKMQSDSKVIDQYKNFWNIDRSTIEY